MTMDVQDLIVVGLGDSFSAGSGNSRNGLVSIDYDQIAMHAHGPLRAGARGPRAREGAIRKTSVTFIHLACGGARATVGFLGPHNGQPPQILELQQILPAGPARGLRLVHHRRQRRALLGGHRAADRRARRPRSRSSTASGRTTASSARSSSCARRWRRVAACFGSGFEGRPCEVTGPSGRDDDTQVVRLPRIPLARPGPRRRR